MCNLLVIIFIKRYCFFSKVENHRTVLLTHTTDGFLFYLKNEKKSVVAKQPSTDFYLREKTFAHISYKDEERE